MARENAIQPLGLMTDPNPHALPSGALRQASNCSMKRPGVITPRPGFKDAVSGWTPTATQEAIEIIPFDGDHLVVSKVGGVGGLQAAWLSDGTSESDVPWVASGNHYPVAYDRGNVYYFGVDGLVKVTSATTAATQAGAFRARQGEPSLIITPTSDQRFLKTTEFCAYRFVLRREDANGYIVRSPPSGRMYVENDLAPASTAAVQFSLPIAAGPDVYQVGDVVEIYRTRTSTVAEVGEDFQLAAEVEISAGDVTTSVAVVYDFTPDDSLGASLYTNPGVRGELQANDPPPLRANDIATYRGSMFYGGTTRRGKLILELVDKNAWGCHLGIADDDDITMDTDALTRAFDIKGGGHAKTSTLGAVKENTFLHDDGAVIGADGTNFAWPTMVTGVTSDTGVTTSTAALTTANDQPTNVFDSLMVDNAAGSTYFIAVIEDTANSAVGNNHVFQGQLHVGLSNAMSPRAMAGEIAYAVNINGRTRDDWVVSVLSGGEEECVLLFELISVNTYGVELSNGNAWKPSVLSAASTAKAVHTPPSDAVPGRLYYSRNQLPEAVPAANFIDIGDRQKAIRRLIPTVDALWILKDDGVWRLTGEGADAGWRVDPISKAQIVAPRAAATFGEVGVAWFDQGVYVLGQGMQRIDQAIDKELEPIAQLIKAQAAGNEPGGAFVRANTLTNEIYVGVPDNGAGETGDTVYVYSVDAKAWTTWEGFRDIRPSGDGLIYAAVEDSANGYGARVERRGTPLDCADVDYSINLATGAGGGTWWQDDSGNGWVPAVGDRVEQGAEPVAETFVTEVSGTDFRLAFIGAVSEDGGGEAGNGTAYVSYESIIEWVAKSSRDPAALKRWIEGAYTWEALYDARRVSVGFKSDASQDDDADVSRLVINFSTLNGISVAGPVVENSPMEFYVPRAYSLAAILRPRVVIKQAAVCWALTSLSLGYEPVSYRHRRGYGGA